MSTERISPDTSLDGVPVARPWWRFRWPAWVMMVLVLIVAFFVIVPGRESEQPTLNAFGMEGWGMVGTYGLYERDIYEHGWPFVFLVRSDTYPIGLDGSWSWPWRLWQDVAEVCTWNLLIDGAFVLVLPCLVIVWWDRRQPEQVTFQFGIGAILVCTALIAGTLAWWCAERSSSQELSGRLAKDGFSSDRELVPRLPHWLRALVGDEALLPLGIVAVRHRLFANPRYGDAQYLVERFPSDVFVACQPRHNEEPFDEQELPPLAGLPAAENLSIEGRRLSSSEFARMPEGVPDREVTDADLRVLEKLPRLRRLYVFGGQFSDAACEHVSQCTSLEILLMEEGVFTSDGFRKLARLNRLRGLGLPKAAPTDANLRELSQLRALEVLDIDGSKLGPEGLRLIASLPKLRHLSIANLHTRWADLSVLSQASHLSLLRLAGLELSEQPSELPSSTFASLTTLDLGGAKIQDKDLAFLAAMPHLVSLSLWNCETIYASGLRRLAEGHQLKNLNLCGTQIGDSDLEALDGLKKLDLLDLQYSKVTKPAAARMKAAHPALRIAL